MEKCSRAVKEMLPQPCSRHFSFIAYTASYSAGLRRSHFVFCHLQNGDKDISRCHQSVMGLKLTAAPLRAVLLLSAKPAHPPHTHRAYRCHQSFPKTAVHHVTQACANLSDDKCTAYRIKSKHCRFEFRVSIIWSDIPLSLPPHLL